MRYILLGTVTAVSLVGPAFAQTLPSEIEYAAAYDEIGEARDLYDAGDPSGALAAAMPLAEAGNPAAMNMVGAILTDAQLPEYDIDAGLVWMMRSAHHGIERAWHNMGLFYSEDHEGIAPNPILEVASFQISAETGYVPSIEELAYLLTYGDPAIVDYERASDVIAQGLDVDPGNAYLTGLLADYAYYGMGREVDRTAAYDLYLEAAQSGYDYAEFSVGYQAYFGDGVPFDIDVAIDYLDRAAAQNYPEAFGHLAEIFSEGDYVAAEFERARDYAERGVAVGDGFSFVILGQMAHYGQGEDVDLERARALYRQGFDNGAAAGLENLANMAYFGDGEPVDYAKSYQMFHQVLEEHPSRAYSHYSIGYMLMRGEGVAADPEGAVAHLEEAHAGGEWYALAELPLLYGHQDYDGPHADLVRALAFCLVASEEGVLADETYVDTADTCTRLEGQASAEQAEAAIALYQTL